MIEPYSFTIPGEPVGKGRARASAVGGFARMYTPKKTSSYEGKVAVIYAALGRPHPDESRPPFAVTIQAHFEKPASWSAKKRAAMDGEPCCKKPDADNIAKIICDALNGLAWHDDSQIAELTVFKTWSSTPYVGVTISQIPQEQK